MSAPSAQDGALVEGERFCFVLPGRLEYREAARVFLVYVCEQLSAKGVFSPDVGHQVISAFVEAFNNAVIHAYRDLPVGSVEIDLEIEPQRLIVRISDTGRGFVPEKVPEPDLDALPEGGLGLFIIKNFMDRVGYERRGDLNVLTMEKKLSARGARGPTE